MEGKTISEMSVETKLIFQRLAVAEIGDFVSYGELSAIIGRDVQKDARHILESARRIAQRENKVLFECVRDSGIKRLDDIGIVGTTQIAVTKIRRISRRGIMKVKCLNDMAKLPKDEKDGMNARLSILAMVSHVTKTKNINLIESRVAETQERLPLMKTIEAFK